MHGTAPAAVECGGSKASLRRQQARLEQPVASRGVVPTVDLAGGTCFLSGPVVLSVKRFL
jgi:hypothetical protein